MESKITVREMNEALSMLQIAPCSFMNREEKKLLIELLQFSIKLCLKEKKQETYMGSDLADYILKISNTQKAYRLLPKGYQQAALNKL